MTTVPHEQWRPFSEYLDQALDLPKADRAAWLAALAQSNPDLAAPISDALSRCDRTGYADFLVEPLLSSEQIASATLIGRHLALMSLRQRLAEAAWVASGAKHSL